MRITSKKLASLKLDPDNSRKHGEVDVAAIAASLTEFGQVSPIVVTTDNTVIKGNGTVMAAMTLGWTEVRAVVTQLTGEQLRAYSIADNQTGLISKWDDRRLADQIEKMENELSKALRLQPAEIKTTPTKPKINATKPEVTYSIRVEGVSQQHKEQVIDLIKEILAEGDYAYCANAF